MAKLSCRIKGHQLVSLETNNIQIKEYECSCCKQKFTTNGYGRIVKLTPYWKQNHAMFEQYFNKQTA